MTNSLENLLDDGPIMDLNIDVLLKGHQSWVKLQILPQNRRSAGVETTEQLIRLNAQTSGFMVCKIDDNPDPVYISGRAILAWKAINS